ncbi:MULTISPECIES: hypothetical protein [Nocardia]|uniref:Uncharacterized protein n=1 Tax=Nocardia africana TaxID=134964 RepID=A0A378X7I9_9NOCA|nr:hypothetical protein [Nocardia africana]MCC3317929.1 hypothetical protein [Nocardia africana]SUA48704.1 Uncharacterised protein [Nocardia africana]
MHPLIAARTHWLTKTFGAGAGLSWPLCGRFSQRCAGQPHAHFANNAPQAQPVHDTVNDDSTGTLDIDWPDGTRATWFLATESLDTLATLIERITNPPDSIKC